MKARERVLRALYAVDTDGTYANAALKEALSAEFEFQADRGLVTEIFRGVLQNRMAIDYVISMFSKIKLKKLSPWIMQILRMGVYQILYMDKIPESAACNESVKLARKYGHNSSAGFVNGVLRSVARNKDKIEFPKDNITDYLSLCYSYPTWMVEMLLKIYGEKECEEILKAGNSVKPPTIRTNLTKTTTSELTEALKAEGITATADNELDYCLYITGGLSVENSPLYKEGKYTLQNKSSMLATEMLAPKSGEFIIDVCAAPGGKTTHIAEKMGDRGRVVAFDIHKHKTVLIENAAKRLGLKSVEVMEQDASKICKEFIGKADRILADVPCSGLGVINKKPDIKWNVKEEDIAELVKIQKEILNTVSAYVKSGGVLVYSTCTITDEENRLQIDNFLKENEDFYKAEEKLLLPHLTEGSGFYICKLQRK